MARLCIDRSRTGVGDLRSAVRECTKCKAYSLNGRKGDTWTAASPVEVFPGPSYSPGSGPNSARTYDVSADGKRFLMIKPVTGSDGSLTLASVVVVQNWLEELKRLVPTRR